MRPTSILYFERLAILSILVGMVFTWIDWEDQIAGVRAAGFTAAVAPLTLGFALAILLLLIVLISRRGSAIAKWVFVALFAFGLVVSAPQVMDALDRGLVGLLQLTQLVVQGMAVYFLFTPEANDWFRRRGRTEPAPAPRP
jgi:hypothetical protein